MRGKGWTSTPFLFPYGITPAYAGKRIFFNPFELLTKDHPRLCGEKLRLSIMPVLIVGSPPPMRGKGKPGSTGSDDFRITPAYAGKSYPKSAPFRRITDHPRLCGEKTKKIPKQRYFFHQPASFSFSLQYT